MTSINIDVWAIIAYLKTVTAITDIVGDNIFRDLPKREANIDKNIYLVIQEPSEVPTFSVKRNRLTIRYMAINDTVTKEELAELEAIVTQELCFESCNWVRDFNGFKINAFVEWESIKDRELIKQRNFIIKDYFVTYFKNG